MLALNLHVFDREIPAIGRLSPPLLGGSHGGLGMSKAATKGRIPLSMTPSFQKGRPGQDVAIPVVIKDVENQDVDNIYPLVIKHGNGK